MISFLLGLAISWLHGLKGGSLEVVELVVWTLTSGDVGHCWCVGGHHPLSQWLREERFWRIEVGCQRRRLWIFLALTRDAFVTSFIGVELVLMLVFLRRRHGIG